MTAPGSNDVASGEARRFLLGELPAADAERFEERLLGNHELFEDVESAEDDLFDDFARDELTPDQRRMFIERFGDQRQRIAFAGALDAKVRNRSVIPIHHTRRAPLRRYLLAAAAVIVVVTGAAMLWRAQRGALRQVTTQVSSRMMAPVVTTSPETSSAITPVSPAASIVTLEIALVSTRGADRVPQLVLLRVTNGVALRIRINPADHFPAYAVDVRKSDGSRVWSGEATVASPGRITVVIPSSLFGSGYYEIAVAGMRAGGSREELGYQTIAINLRASSP